MQVHFIDECLYLLKIKKEMHLTWIVSLVVSIESSSNEIRLIL